LLGLITRVCGQRIFGEEGCHAFANGVRSPLDVHETHAMRIIEGVVAALAERGQNLIGDPIQDFLSRFRIRHGNPGKQDKDFPAVPRQQL
jgi:hypothetical protein